MFWDQGAAAEAVAHILRHKFGNTITLNQTILNCV